jgi:hypothetical protein
MSWRAALKEKAGLYLLEALSTWWPGPTPRQFVNVMAASGLPPNKQHKIVGWLREVVFESHRIAGVSKSLPKAEFRKEISRAHKIAKKMRDSVLAGHRPHPNPWCSLFSIEAKVFGSTDMLQKDLDALDRIIIRLSHLEKNYTPPAFPPGRSKPGKDYLEERAAEKWREFGRDPTTSPQFQTFCDAVKAAGGYGSDHEN